MTMDLLSLFDTRCSSVEETARDVHGIISPEGLLMFNNSSGSSSVLPSNPITEALQSHTEELRETAAKDYQGAHLTLIATLEETLEDVAGTHSRPVPALQAATQLCEQLTSWLGANRDRITSGFGPSGSLGSNGSNDPSKEQVRELETENQELQRAALRASDLQTQLDRLTAEVARLEAEKHSLQKRLDSGDGDQAANADKITELEGQVATLNDDKQALDRERSDLDSKLHEALDTLEAFGIKPGDRPDQDNPDQTSVDNGGSGGILARMGWERLGKGRVNRRGNNSDN